MVHILIRAHLDIRNPPPRTQWFMRWMKWKCLFLDNQKLMEDRKLFTDFPHYTRYTRLINKIIKCHGSTLPPMIFFYFWFQSVKRGANSFFVIKENCWLPNYSTFFRVGRKKRLVKEKYLKTESSGNQYYNRTVNFY